MARLEFRYDGGDITATDMEDDALRHAVTVITDAFATQGGIWVTGVRDDETTQMHWIPSTSRVIATFADADEMPTDVATLGVANIRG